MGGFGSLDSFNKTLSRNRELLKKKKAFDIIKPHNRGLKDMEIKNLGSATPEQIRYYKEKSIKESQENDLRRILIIIVSIMAICFSIIYFMTSWGKL